MKVTVTLALVLAACGGGAASSTDKSTTPPSISPATAPSCEDAIAHLGVLAVDASGATNDEQRRQAQADIDAQLGELRSECESAWTPTFRSCVVAAKSRDDVKVCDSAQAVEKGDEAVPE